MIGFKMDKRLNKYLVRKYIKYLNDTIESLYSKHDLTKEEIELFMREFNGFKEKVNQESQIHHSFKEKINSIKFEIKRNPRKSKIRFILEKVFFFLNFSSLSMGILYDDINRKDRGIIVEEIRNQISHLAFKINDMRIFI
jgi:hypothetical protein